MEASIPFPRFAFRRFAAVHTTAARGATRREGGRGGAASPVTTDRGFSPVLVQHRRAAQSMCDGSIWLGGLRQ
eukprot:scaffold862_cov52-Phaeocystis_antarctica.AAC.1